MKIILKSLINLCRNTPSFRGKWRLVKWLEQNRDYYADFDPVNYRIYGGTLKCYPKTNFHLYMHGPKKNEKIIPIIKKYVEPGAVAVDLGAHSGYFTTALSKAVGIEGKVYAVEASPIIYNELTATITENELSNVVPINKAISDANDTVDFYIAPTWKSEISSLRSGEGDSISIESVSLDSIIPITEAISFVKIDVEGAEMKALTGMKDIIQRSHPTLVIEITDKWLKQLGSSSAEVFSFLHQNGYAIHEIREHDSPEIKGPPAHQIDALCLAHQKDIAS